MIHTYLDKYLQEAYKSLYDLDLDSVYDVIRSCALGNRPILVFGNGGSAAVAEHLSCDFTKGIGHFSSTQFPRVESLVSNQSLITAIANDYGYKHIFEKQVEYSQNRFAVVIAISSSGNSENVVLGLKAATVKKFPTIALVGFDGGRIVADNLADLIIHVKAFNYGIVEDCHQIIMHCIAQQLCLELSSDVKL